PASRAPPAGVPAGGARPQAQGYKPPVRNAGQVPPPAPAAGAPAGATPASVPAAEAPVLSPVQLANASPMEQKQMLGEVLYMSIVASQPELAGKITGMLLEMDNAELLHLLETPDSLNLKVSEALAVLQEFQNQADAK
ncbi:hypothetical protein EW026_g3313, partial [Hermanssonia centrifuga]